MENKNDDQKKYFSELHINDLIRKQSVRATFKLPVEVIDLLAVIAGQIGIKQKTLLDQLSEDAAVLDALAEDAKGGASVSEENDDERRQKTFVISRRSLHCINTIAKKQQVPRDRLVEISIRRLMPIIESELHKHNIRKSIFEDMDNHLRAGRQIRAKARKLLGEEDQLFEMIDKQVRLAEKNIAAIDSIIEKGMPMEDW